MRTLRVIKKCGICKKAKATFVNNGSGYCGRSSMLGIANMFGYCKTTKTESPELKKYLAKMDKLGLEY